MVQILMADTMAEDYPRASKKSLRRAAGHMAAVKIGTAT